MPNKTNIWFFPLKFGIELAVSNNNYVIKNTGGRFTQRENVKENLLDSALNTPLHLHEYEGQSDIVVLATRLCYRIAKAHAFDDGNKRTAFLLMLTFLTFNKKVINKTSPLLEMGETLAKSFLSASSKDIGNFDKCNFGIAIEKAVANNDEEILKSLLKKAIVEKPVIQAFFENQQKQKT